jgi:acyl dehydratase
MIDRSFIGRVLHGEQNVTCRAPVRVGDTVTFRTRISGIHDKKNRARNG